MGMEFSIKRILVTGGCGFIGANFIRLELEINPHISITNLDALTYAGNPDNLADLSGNPRYRFVHGDIADRRTVLKLVADGGYDAIINFAAESHVDRSISDATPFLCGQTSWEPSASSMRPGRPKPRAMFRSPPTRSTVPSNPTSRRLPSPHRWPRIALMLPARRGPISWSVPLTTRTA